MTACICSPAMTVSAQHSNVRVEQLRTASPNSDSIYPGLIQLADGQALLGTDHPIIPGDGEGPLRTVPINAYALAATTVTVRQFSAFVSETGYVTDAERMGYSMVFAQQVAADAKVASSVFGTPWWRIVQGAHWRNPVGASKISASMISPAAQSDPVVHVSWHDATTYCDWAKGRLPTEVEWEHAARGGLGDVRYPWGNEDPFAKGAVRCNIWQGDFPNTSIKQAQPVSVDSFSRNNNGFYNMCGNVWEWTDDKFDNGFGPESLRRTLKGGSYLCHLSYCYRYRIAARIGVSAESTTSHQGFRIAFD